MKVEIATSGEESEIRNAGNATEGSLPFEERLFAVGESSEEKLTRLQNYVAKCEREKEQQNAEEKKKDEEEKDEDDVFCDWILGIDKEEDEKVKEEEKRVSKVTRVKEGEVTRAKEEEEVEEEEEKEKTEYNVDLDACKNCLLYTSPSPRDLSTSRMPSSA